MSKKIVLAYSGGLDTSFCVPYLKEKFQAEVITVTVNTGGFESGEMRTLAQKSRKLGAKTHYNIDARETVFNEHILWLIKANALRGGVYPLSVSAERVTQAKEVVRIAKKCGAFAIAHGSTGAGNDQVRFDVAFKTLAPDLKLITPVRELGLSREQEADYLAQHGHPVKLETREYSINRGLWGTTIGGKETHDSWEYPPEKVFQLTAPIQKTPDKPLQLIIGFEKGAPCTINGKSCGNLRLVSELNRLGGQHGVGRGIHLGDTILGLKGRIAFEAPAPLILIKAHQELEKLVLTKSQLFWKKIVEQAYGDFVHHGMFFDPVMRDLEAYIGCSQTNVTGAVKVLLHSGNIIVHGTKSDFSLMNRKLASYGEESAYWSGADAEGFSKIFGLPSMLAALVSD